MQLAVTWGENLLYYNGEQVADFTDGSLGASSTIMYIGDRYTLTDNAFNNTIKSFLVFNKVLTPTQIATLSDNPYQLWQPPVYRYYSFGAAAEPPATTGRFGYIRYFFSATGDIL